MQPGFPREEYRAYLRNAKVPEAHWPVYEDTAEKFVGTFPEIPVPSIGRKHLDQYLEQFFAKGSSKKLIRNLNIVCEDFLKFARQMVSAQTGKREMHATGLPPNTGPASAGVFQPGQPGVAAVKTFPTRPRRGPAKPIGIFSTPPCPHCSAELTTSSNDGAMQAAMKVAGVGGAIFVHALLAKLSCAEHGVIDSADFPAQHRMSLLRRRCAFGVLGLGIIVGLVILLAVFGRD